MTSPSLPAPCSASPTEPDPVCRHCGRAHWIENCPAVVRQFVTAERGVPDCYVCGAPVPGKRPNGGPRVFCEECRRTMERTQPGRLRRAANASELATGGVNSPRVVVSREYVVGARLYGFDETLKMGHAEPGMVVQYMDGQSSRYAQVIGEMFRPQTLTIIEYHKVRVLKGRVSCKP